jgi:hypothetical protein
MENRSLSGIIGPVTTPRLLLRPAPAVAARLAGLLGVAVALAHLHPVGRPATLCALRALTGIPCPFCGGTTAAVRIGAGDLAGALHASPLAVLAAPVVAALPVLRSWLPRVSRPVALTALLIALGGSEIWQLYRFGLV